ncbi:FadR/GntR family transcriptional regulator [Nicoliella lavandulae]|uniref:GntR family transcriptional regulator n=1 Tax=Nicoliella lavandulae TaxID=3082954 RepID=A0ABU8SMY3_9LACO
MSNKKGSLSHVAAQNIVKYIRENGLTAGDKLPTEQQLMTYCNVGRSTIREAIHSLVYTGVVTVKQGSGTYVRQLVEVQVNNPLLRKNIKMIEHEVIDELVNDDVSDDEWITLKAMLGRRNQLLREHKFKDFIDLDVKFHTKIVDLANNTYLSKWYRELMPLWKQHLAELTKQQSDFETNIDYHNRLFNALIERDAKTAVQMIERVGNHGKEA